MRCCWCNMAFGLYDFGTEKFPVLCVCATLGRPVPIVVTRTFSTLIQCNDECANKVDKVSGVYIRGRGEGQTGGSIDLPAYLALTTHQWSGESCGCPKMLQYPPVWRLSRTTTVPG